MPHHREEEREEEFKGAGLQRGAHPGHVHLAFVTLLILYHQIRMGFFLHKCNRAVS